MMELKITSMTPADRLYVYSQSSQLEGQTGCIGHLRGDFGGGQEFFSSWFDHRREYKTDEFKAELDEVVNTLREKDGLLCTRDSMTRFCYQNPELSLRETTAPSMVLRCRRPSTPICSGATPIMETTIFTSTPTLPDSWNTTWKRPNRASGLSRPATKSCSVSPMATTSAFSRAAEEPATAPAGLLTKPILKPAEGIPAPFIISANLQSVWSSLTGA